MRAVQVEKFGGPETLSLVEISVPEPGPGQVRIKVAATALNPVDAQTRAGLLPIEPARLPVGLGWDVAGTVDALGPGVADYSVGDAVIGLDDQLVKDIGTYAEYVVLSAAAIALAPQSVDLRAASTLPLNAVTAAQSLELIDLAPGQTLLVTGAAGAVGGYTVALAAARGLHVVALAGVSDEDAVRSWGAATFVPRADDPAAAVRAVRPDGVDGAIDAADLGAPVLGAISDGGRYVTLAPLLGPVAPERGISVLEQFVHHDGALLAELVRQVDAGTLPLRVAARFPLDDVAAAHELLEKGGRRGRVVLVV